ncbi:DUF6357 family protein [Lentzea sp. NBRC 102530]|uniref:DUF6357 family protein n=1 Tax=Lentzea sp. NBRC 102530 TaxID=3032201 RepID=UPI0024A1D2B7|nr:DUF6357 family protein [Lentzea sp. NBRC 102530]GLY47775.1 hypothetical protein Lesp01_14310 [Lentzea sp. NBRC 102530]
MRPLTFSDDGDDEQDWLPGGSRSAADAFLEFVARRRGEDTTSFSMEDSAAEEALVFMLDIGAICRVRGWQDPHTEYRVVTSRSDHHTLATEFARGGFAALDLHGPWLPDAESFLQARSAHLGQRAARNRAGRDERGAELRSEFDRSVLRRTHPRELRRRLEVLTRAGGREPATVTGVTHYRTGDAVNAWFTAGGRGIVVTFDPAGPLGSTEDARAHAALYDGVPPDLLALVRNVPETRAVPHPDGGTLVAATGIFTFSGPCAMADGLVTRLQEDGLGIEATGLGLLESLLEGPAPDAEPAAPLDPEALTRFCRIWADTGYNDRWDTHYVLFDSNTVEEAGPARDDLLELVRTLGLERVDAPPGASTGEVWVRTDPRIDAELGNWS